MHLDKDNITPTNWLTLAPLSNGVEEVTILYDLWDEDIVGGGVIPSLRGHDDHCDIVPGEGSLVWFERGSIKSFGSGKNIITNTGWSGHDGAGNEAVVHFNIKLEDTKRRPPYELKIIPAPFDKAPLFLLAAPSEFGVRLEWAGKFSDETGFEIERKTGGGKFEKIGTVRALERKYTDLNVSDGGVYTYRIRAYSVLNSSVFNDGTYSGIITIKNGGYSNEAMIKVSFIVRPRKPIFPEEQMPDPKVLPDPGIRPDEIPFEMWNNN
jgi:hypothetical protein